MEKGGLPNKLFDGFRLSLNTENTIGYFQVVILLNDKKYRYGFTINSQSQIESEWLFGNAYKKETYYFKRKHHDIQVNPEFFKEGQKLPYEKLRNDTLFLTFCSAYDGVISKDIRGYFAEKVLFDSYLEEKRLSSLLRGHNNWTNSLVEQGDKSSVLSILKSAGLQYSDINISTQEIAKDLIIKQVNLSKPIFDEHQIERGESLFNLESDESEGTKKLYSYIGKLHFIFENGGLLVSDEIDSNFHPTLLRKLIELFQNDKLNKGGAQLLCTTHDTNLLDHDFMRRDQFYFTEKTVFEDSRLYSLSDLKGIRNNADFARQYLAGFYGALPILDHYIEDLD